MNTFRDQRSPPCISRLSRLADISLFSGLVEEGSDSSGPSIYRSRFDDRQGSFLPFDKVFDFPQEPLVHDSMRRLAGFVLPLG